MGTQQREQAVVGPNGLTGAETMMIADRASAAAGLRVVELAKDFSVVQMVVRADMVNGHGITHGGYVFLLADTAFACACNTTGSVTVAAGADITFLAPTKPGDVLTAQAHLRSRRGRTGVFDVTVTRESDDGDEVVAEFRGRSVTLRPETAAEAEAGAGAAAGAGADAGTDAGAGADAGTDAAARADAATEQRAVAGADAAGVADAGTEQGAAAGTGAGSEQGAVKGTEQETDAGAEGGR